MKVLLISPHFPPDSTAGTHRVRLIAPELQAHGWEPTVLTVDPRDYDGPLDTALAESVPTDLRVIRTRAWPSRLTRRVGFTDLGLRAFAGLRREAMRLLAHERFDALFITIYPTYPALVGPQLKKRFRVPFVLDYQDPWVGEWGRSVGPAAEGRPDWKSRASRQVAAWTEPLALGAADAVTAVSRATFEQALSRSPKAAPKLTAEIPIGWNQRDFDRVRDSRASAGRGLVRARDEAADLVHASYVGTLLPTGFEPLRALFAAVGRLRQEHPARGGRLRLHFFGTSNQRSDSAPPRVLPIARELGVADLVTEQPARLDYFDALRALIESDVVLLLGSLEEHYTPSKVFPALLAERPILALLHEASSATDLLRRFGRPPSIWLVGYDRVNPAAAQVDAIVEHLGTLVDSPIYRRDATDSAVLQPTSARSLAARFATVFDEVRLPSSRGNAVCRDQQPARSL